MALESGLNLLAEDGGALLTEAGLFLILESLFWLAGSVAMRFVATGSVAMRFVATGSVEL